MQAVNDRDVGMSLHILHILDHSIPLHSGYTFRTRAILEQQRALGWKTSHITSVKHALAAASTLLEEDVDGLHFYRTLRPTGAMARLPVFDQIAVINSLAERLEQVAREIRPDILHAHSPALNGVAALRVGKKLNIPVVYEVRAFWEDAAVDHGTSREGGARYRATRALETHVLKHADAVTCICEGLRNDIVARGIAARKVTVIPNAVDLDRFTLGGEPDAALAVQLGLAGMRVLGFIGSFYAYEGLPLLFQALPKILTGMPNVRLLLVGGGPQEAFLKHLAAELHIADKVVFTGRVPHDQVRRYYDLVDIFAYPRLSMRLTELVTPLKPLEAMAQGRLVLASDVGGHRELIRHGENGMLFRADDVDALAGAAVDLLASEEKWPALRAQARRYVETERNWPVSVAHYKAVYERLLSPERGMACV